MMPSSWRDLTIGMRTTCERKNAQLEIPWPTWLRMRPQVGPRHVKNYRNTPWEILAPQGSGEFWHLKEDERLRQEGHSCSSRATKNTGTAQGISNRGRCVRTGAVPELKSL